MSELPYRSFSRFIKERFGQKVYRLSLDAGFTCPNWDGLLGTGGCAYCSERGSWGPRGQGMPLELQVRREIDRVRRRYGALKYVAYFQAYTNTYAQVDTLRRLYDTALGADPDIVGLAIGTRPDCVENEKLDLIYSYRERGYEVWVEYGLQSADDRTLQRIGRGHTVDQFKDAVLRTADRGILAFAHVIAGLPGEGREQFMRTARFLASLPVGGVKIHNLNILEGTRMARWHRRGEVQPLELDAYVGMVVDFLELSSPDLVVSRLVADAPSSLLIAPRWSLDKQRVVREILRRFQERGTCQGMLVKGSVR